MIGNHRAIQQTNKTRLGVAGVLTAGALLVAPIGVAIAVPGVANATPQEDAVVQQTNAAGYHYSNIPAMLGNAHTVCDRLAVGQSRDQIAGDIAAQMGDPAEANTFVNIAVANLCP